MMNTKNACNLLVRFFFENRSFSTALEKVKPHVEYSEGTKIKPKMKMKDFYRFAEGPDTFYPVPTGHKMFKHDKPFCFYYGERSIPQLSIAYETWGKLNADKSNAVLLFTGRSASSHAKQHELNMDEGWWEHVVGSGSSIDTDKYFVICANQLASCYGTTGPSSINTDTGRPYGTDFPVCSVKDMVDAQILLLDHLGINQLNAVIGSSLGGKCSLALAALHPHRTRRMISISACAQSHPSSIALRYLQRRCIMEDENWNGGHYYGNKTLFKGANFARSVTTLGDRRGKEWSHRFGRSRVRDRTLSPTLGIDFEIESYIEYVGKKLASSFDPNSLLYISKAMDLFDISEWFDGDVMGALAQVKCKSLIVGVKDDFVVPVWQQRELANMILKTGNRNVEYSELRSEFGHSSFLLDKNEFTSSLKKFMDDD